MKTEETTVKVPKTCCEDCGGMLVSVEDIVEDFIPCPSSQRYLITKLITQYAILLTALQGIVANAGYNNGYALKHLRELRVTIACLDATRTVIASVEEEVKA